MCSAVHLRHQKTTTASGTFLGWHSLSICVFIYVCIYLHSCVYLENCITA